MKTSSLLLILVFSFGLAKAQDPIFSQFYANPVYVNPSLNGMSEATRVSTNYRKQWVNSATTFSTFSSTIEQQIKNSSSAIGFQFIKDAAGDNVFSTTGFNFVYSYAFKINHNWQIRSGIQPGVAQRSFNSSNLIFEDQLDPRDGVIKSTQERLNNEIIYYPDLSTGVTIMSDKAYFGFAVHHLNRPSISYNSYNDQKKELLNHKYTLHGGLKIASKKSIHDYFSPNIIFQQQGLSRTFSLGSYFKRKNLTGGAWYRVNQAVILFFGMELDQFRIGLSTDVPTNNYSNRGLSHEISLAALINKKTIGRPKRKELVFCPTF